MNEPKSWESVYNDFDKHEMKILKLKGGGVCEYYFNWTSCYRAEL